MRPLFHPPAADVTVQGILHALADPVRAAIFAAIAGSDDSLCCSTFLTVGDKAIPKSSLSQHFTVLREAGLVRSERLGVEMQNTSRCAEIDARYPGLLQAILRAHQAQAAGKRRARKK